MTYPAIDRRKLFAWLLLGALCLQRLVCLIGVEVMHVVEVRQDMTGLEQAFANQLTDLDGTMLYVRAQDQENQVPIRNIGYLPSIVLAEEVGDEIVYLTLSNEPFRTYETVNLTKNVTPDQEDPFCQTRVNKSRMFSDFYFDQMKIPSQLTSAETQLTLPLPAFWENPVTKVPTPPPRQA